MTSAAEAEELGKYTAETELYALGEVFVTETAADLKNAVIEIKIVVDELKSTVTDVKKENAFLKKLNAELVLQIAELKDQNANMKDVIDFLGDEMCDFKIQMADLKKDLKKDLEEDLEEDLKEIPDPALAFIPRVLEVRKLVQNSEPSAVEAHEARKNSLKLNAERKRAMLEGEGSNWLVE